MPRVICDLPNASCLINGVKFHPLEDGGLISDEISEDQANLFASITGYTIDEEEREPVKVVVAPAPTTRTTRNKAADKKAAAEQVPAAPVAETQPEPTIEPTAAGDAGAAGGAGETEEVF